MKAVFLVVVVLLGCVWAQAEEGERTHFLEAFPFSDPKELANVVVETQRFEPEVVAEPRPFAFACPSVPIPPDTDNVNQLKPGHVKVMMAMGDSITAAMSAKDTSVTSLHEYRGLSYAIGGDEGVITLPNLLKHYTVTGYPIGMSTGIGKRPALKTNGFNAALSGAISSGMLEQAQWLERELRANKAVNFEKDWKVLSLWIGSNNICQVCNDELANNAQNYKKYVYEALDYVYARIPRVFVNLLANMDVTKIYEYKAGACTILHPYECPCGTTVNPITREKVRLQIREYIYAAHEIAANYTHRKNPEFAVVVQPFLQDSPVYNRQFLSAADCFHPSAIAHEAISTALWNAMITPAAQKKKSWGLNETAECATSSSMLYTN